MSLSFNQIKEIDQLSEDYIDTSLDSITLDLLNETSIIPVTIFERNFNRSQYDLSYILEGE